MQSVAIPQINRRHTNPFPSFVTLIVRFDLVDPEIPHVLGAVLAEPDVDQEIGVLLAGSEVRRSVLGAEFIVNRVAEKRRCLPTTKGAGAFGFVIEGRTQGDDAEDLFGPLFECFRLKSGVKNLVPCLVPSAPCAQ